MDTRLQLQRIDSLLSAGETLVWSGVPARGFRFQRGDMTQIPFSVMFLGFSIFWESMVVTQGHAPIFFRLWGIPFIVAGLYFAIGRYVLDAYLRRQTTYALTDRAAYVVTGGFGAKTLVFNANSISPIELVNEAEGSGTIHFGARSVGRQTGFGGWIPDSAQFVGITDVSKVYALAKNIALR